MPNRFSQCVYSFIVSAAACFVLICFERGLNAEEIKKPEKGKSTTVFVAVESAELHSGPTKDYYPTAILERGQVLDAFRKTDDGWLGVRPPEGSFSWVPAKDAYLLPGGKVIEIVEEDAVSWIGTELGTAKQYRWQIELQIGEQLKVLGEASMKDSDGNPALWYKVSPPSGEFRWVHESAVSKSAPTRSPSPTLAPPSNKPSEIAEAEGSGSSRQENAVVTASAVESATTEDVDLVQPAQYETDVFGDGEMVGQPIESEVIYAEPYSESNAELGPVYNHQHQGNPNSAPANFGGYHAFDLGEDGLRFTLAERFIQKRGPMIDPLEHDPFSLSMPAKNTLSPHTRVPPGVIPRRTKMHNNHGGSGYNPPQAISRDRPWRDPRTLRQNRMNGYANSIDQRTPQTLVNDIREQVNRLGDSMRSIVGGRSQDSYQAPEDLDLDRNLEFGGGFNKDFDSTSETAISPIPTENDLDFYSKNDGRNGELRSKRVDASGNASDINWYGAGQRSGSSARPSTNNVSGTAVTDEIERLKVTLTEMVARPPSQWNLEPLVARAKYLIDTGVSPLERGQARLLLERVEQFQEHARRSAFVPGANFQAGYQSNPTGTPSQPNSPFRMAGYQQPVSGASIASQSSISRPSVSLASATSSPRDSILQDDRKQFDATGWLVPVHATTPGQPTHALTNASGAVIAYLSGLPGMNLTPYLNQPVGVVGLRGYLPQLQAGHIQAERIIPLR